MVHSGVVKPSCGNTQGSGLSAFTGGASSGTAGVATQRFIAPLGQGLWADRFHAFFPSSVPVLISNITATAVAPIATHPVFATLDSRRLNATTGVWVGTLADPVASARQLIVPGDYTFRTNDSKPLGWLWHDSIGYVVAAPAASGAMLRVSLNPSATGAWSSIGAEGVYGNATGPLFTMWQEFPSPVIGAKSQYITVPDVELSAFQSSLAADSTTFGVTFGVDGQWSAAVDSGVSAPLGGQRRLALSAFVPGVADVRSPVAPAFPPVTVSCAGAGAAFVLTLNASTLAVAAASPSQAPWTGSVAVDGVVLETGEGAGFACYSNGTVALTAPPGDGSSTVVVCQRAAAAAARDYVRVGR